MLHKLLLSPTENISPNFPLSKISLGPDGQLEDIMGTPETWASIKVFGKPSYLDGKINKSDDLIKSEAFFWYPANFIFLLKLLSNIYLDKIS